MASRLSACLPGTRSRNRFVNLSLGPSNDLEANDILGNKHAYALVPPVSIEFIYPFPNLCYCRLRWHWKMLFKFSNSLLARVPASRREISIYSEPVRLFGI